MYFLRCFSFITTLFSTNQLPVRPVDLKPEIKDPGPFSVVAKNFDYSKPLDRNAEEQMNEWIRRKMLFIDYSRKKALEEKNNKFIFHNGKKIKKLRFVK